MLRNSRICSIEHINGLLDHGLLLGLPGQAAGGGADDHGLGTKDSPTFAGLTINSADASDQIQIYHDNTDMYIRPTDGSIVFLTDEGDNTTTLVDIKGKGTGRGNIIIRDENDAEFLSLRTATGKGLISVQGSSPVSLRLQQEADIPVTIFESATEGETQELQIYGFGTGFGGIESLDVSVEQYAANTAEFFGLDAYMFQGNIITLNNTHEDTDGGRESRHDFKGQQSGGEETTLARLEAAHDGSADDEKGYLDLFINDGNDGDAPTHMVRVNSVGVSINTATPVVPLTVKANAVGAPPIRAHTTGDVVNADLGSYALDNAALRLYNASADLKVLLYSNGDSYLNGGNLDIGAGAISSATLTFSTVGPTDNLDVSGVNTLFIDNSSNAVTIGGLAGGVDGQVLYIALINAGANNVILEHNETGATQKIYLHRGADETLNTEYGGWILVCHGGTDWHDCSHARHV